VLRAGSGRTGRARGRIAARPTLDPGQQVPERQLGGGVVGLGRAADVAGTQSSVEGDQPRDTVSAEVARPQLPAISAPTPVAAALGPGMVARTALVGGPGGIGRAAVIPGRWTRMGDA
jgi:hypothetical protein